MFMIRHITSLSNTENGKVIDPLKTKHGIVTALEISELSGWIDEATHLNLDFPEHLMRTVYIAEKLEIGGRIILKGDKFNFALVNQKDYKHYGKINLYERLEQFRNAHYKTTNNIL